MGKVWCSELPFVQIATGDYPKVVTFIYPYYDNPKTLRRHLDLWMSYDKELWPYFRVIISDDGSPNYPAEDILQWTEGIQSPVPIRLFRMDVDIRWNWPAAKNVAMYHAEEGWCLLTDMDHLVPEETLRNCIYGQHEDHVVYGFSRMGAKTYPHPNSWFMTRKLYWEIGGYNEANAGYYGNDGAWRRRCVHQAPMQILRDPLNCIEHEGDASTSRYARKQPEDAKGKEILAKWGLKKPPVLTFPYHEVHL